MLGPHDKLQSFINNIATYFHFKFARWISTNVNCKFNLVFNPNRSRAFEYSLSAGAQ